MRNLVKLPKPQILIDNHDNWLGAFKADPTNETKKYRYRDSEIKSCLKEETSSKCVYCESKIGHNVPGDIEHKIPSSKCINLHFAWENLTIACPECNRRKNDYYKEGDSFIDPYSDDVESILEHYGPIVFWETGNNRIETSIRMLELDTHTRTKLIARKIEKMEQLNTVIERFAKEEDPILKKLHKKQIASMTNINAEYSAMIGAILKHKRINVN